MCYVHCCAHNSARITSGHRTAGYLPFYLFFPRKQRKNKKSALEKARKKEIINIQLEMFHYVRDVIS